MPFGAVDYLVTSQPFLLICVKQRKFKYYSWEPHFTINVAQDEVVYD